MNIQNFDGTEQKFKKFLKHIFQFNKNQIDLNFGIYKIFKHKQNEIYRFIENQLSELINDALDKETLNLDEKERYKNIVFEHILNFFKRFYDKGDFYPVPIFSQAKNKKGAYCLDYNGEEVLLYWVTKNQHYIKSLNYYNHYAFFINNKEFEFLINEVEDLNSNQKDTRKFLLTGEIDFQNNKIVIKIDHKKESKDNFEKELNVENLYKLLKENKIEIDKKDLEYHINKFKNLISSDFFIHKHLKRFLIKELNYYLKNEIVDFEDERTLKEAKITKAVSEKIIEFLAKMEDLQLLLWEKKKFAYNVNYVVTLDKLNLELIKEIEESDGFENQKEEWIEELKLINDLPESIYKVFSDWKQIKDIKISKEIFTKKYQDKWNDVFDTNEASIEEVFYKDFELLKEFLKQIDTKKNKKSLFYKNEYSKINSNLIELYKKYKILPIDTKHFKDLEYKILEQFEDLDNDIDGILIKSDNYQALNNLLNKYKEEIDLIYIDPPFNTGKDFLYKDNYQDSTWLTLMESRLKLAYDLLNKKGSIYLQLDYRANHYGRFLLDNIFGKNNFVNEIIWRFGWISGYKTSANLFMRNHQTILFFKKNELFFNKSKAYINYESIPFKQYKSVFNEFLEKIGLSDKNIDLEKTKLSFFGEKVYKFEKNRENSVKQKYPYEDIWNGNEYDEDLNSIMIQSFVKEKTKLAKELTQKPESLLRRIIDISSNKKNIILDFFTGSGTTLAVAHKLDRKWIGVELGEHFETIILPRMKKVLYGEQVGISKDINWQGGGFFKYFKLEQYEDTLENIELKNLESLNKKNEEIKKLKSIYPDLAEEGMLNILTDFVLEHSKSLLTFTENYPLKNPFDFSLIINKKKENVDLIETFNLLANIKVEKIFERKFENKKYVFVIGKKEIIIWRELKENVKDISEFALKEEKFLEKIFKEKNINITKKNILYTNAIREFPIKLNSKVKDIAVELQNLLIKDIKCDTLEIEDKK